MTASAADSGLFSSGPGVLAGCGVAGDCLSETGMLAAGVAGAPGAVAASLGSLGGPAGSSAGEAGAAGGSPGGLWVLRAGLASAVTGLGGSVDEGVFAPAAVAAVPGWGASAGPVAEAGVAAVGPADPAAAALGELGAPLLGCS